MDTCILPDDWWYSAVYVTGRPANARSVAVWELRSIWNMWRKGR